ncbi:MAG: hypothetical protein AB7T31_00140 [Gemmatimonadales bacterium]
MTASRIGLGIVLAYGCATMPDPPVPAAPVQAPRADVCTSGGPDIDLDGLGDACELELARFFAPVLVVAPVGCAHAEGLPPGGYFHGAQRVRDAVRLAYLPAYFVDCGWSGFKCHLPGVDCSPHPGDSELIALDVVRDEGAWSVRAIFLSAHCSGEPEADCRWYRDDGLSAFAWAGTPAGSAPVVWVAEGRQANYPSRSRCDRGHHSIDTCDRNTLATRFPVRPDRNIGSREAGIDGRASAAGCVSGAFLEDAGAAADAEECFWRDTPFRGWQARGAGVTPYAYYLRDVAEF